MGFRKKFKYKINPLYNDLLLGYWHHFIQRKISSRFYVPSYEHEGWLLLKHAHHWSIKLHITLKSIYNNLNEKDQFAQVVRDKALVEKGTSP